MLGGSVVVVIGYFLQSVLLDPYIIDLFSAFPLSAYALKKAGFFDGKVLK